MVNNTYNYLLSDLHKLKGVGAKTCNMLKKKKINNIFDLLWRLPKSYTDRSKSTKIKDLKIGEVQTITVTPYKYNFPRIRNLPNRIYCKDNTGEIDCVFFNSYEGYIKKILPLNKEVVVSGKVGQFKKKYQITNPKYVSEDASFYKVTYPDNRTGFIKKNEAIIYGSWLKNLKSTPENIEVIAKKMNGFPYLWGGTSTKGMDCSGFTKMVYLMNGYIIPRDASQQINAGKTIDYHLKFDGLKKGDLLFFGKKATADSKQRVTHVGIWLGNKKMEFIHSSGNVHISSMHPEQPNYDDFNRNRYIGSKRYLNSVDQNIGNLKDQIKL